MSGDPEEDVVMELLRKASDHDPKRMHSSMWPAIEELAAREGIEVPPPLVTRKFTIEVTARFPDHGEFEQELCRRFHEVIANEYMASSPDLMGYAGPLVQRCVTIIEPDA